MFPRDLKDSKGRRFRLTAEQAATIDAELLNLNAETRLSVVITMRNKVRELTEREMSLAEAADIAHDYVS